MPVAIPNGGGGSDPTTSEAAAYSQAKNKPPGNQTAQEQALVQSFEAAVTGIAQGWQDSGGTGGRQAAVALRVAAFAGELSALRNAAVNQYAEEAASETAKARKAQAEMHGSDTQAFVALARLLFELEERLNDSPY